LTNLLNSTGYGFNIRLNNTTLSKLNHLLYMDDIKLYASKKNHILSLLTITENFSNDIGMSFGIDKCKTQSICRGTLRKFRIYSMSQLWGISEIFLEATKNTNSTYRLILGLI
jgi:hypothetical protein